MLKVPRPVPVALALTAWPEQVTPASLVFKANGHEVSG